MAFSGCLDTLTVAKQQNLVVVEEAKEKTSLTKVYTKDDFSVVNRFESKFNPFLHEYSFKAPTTMNNCINKLSCSFIEQKNYLSGPIV